MSDWGHSHYKFIFLEDFNSDKTFEELGDVVKGIREKLSDTIAKLEDPLRHEVEYEPDSTIDGIPQLAKYAGEIDEGFIEFDGKKHRVWVYDVEVKDNFSQNYFDAALKELLPQSVQDAINLESHIHDYASPLYINEFCMHFHCVCDWIYHSESSCGEVERWMIGVDGTTWLDPKENTTNQSWEDVVKEKFYENVVACDWFSTND